MTNKARMMSGMMEVECVILNPDGTVKSVETTKRPVVFEMNAGEQITKIKEA